ncbi:protein FAR1-RELATED SEQUENCE 6-like, partial [Fagus crenata]
IGVNEEGLQDIELKNSPVVVNLNVTNDENLLGMVVYSDDEAYKLYNDYATRIGFSIRKEKLRFAKAVLRQRVFVCSKEGFQRDSDLSKIKKFKKLQTRTGCKASIRFTVEDGEWKVTHFNPNHNHELAKPEERQFLRSDQKVTIAHSGVLCDHTQSTNMNDELSVTLRRNELMPSDYDNFTKSAATTQDIDLKDSPVIVNINVTKDETLLGMVVYSDDEAYKLYKDYATRIGFSIRKEKLRFAKAVVRQREFVCSKEGFQ